MTVLTDVLFIVGQPFRFGPSNVPIELWPMGFIIGAGLFGGSFALYHHLSSDDVSTGHLFPSRRLWIVLPRLPSPFLRYPTYHMSN